MNKPSKMVRKNISLLVLLGLTIWLGGCGQKGPLVLPEKPTTNEASQNQST